jgi:hypothetical protein
MVKVIVGDLAAVHVQLQWCRRASANGDPHRRGAALDAATDGSRRGLSSPIPESGSARVAALPF